MDLNALLASLTSDLGLGAAGAIVLFALTVGLDNVLGVLNAIKDKTFQLAKLGSFLESQYGTVRALVVLGAVASAVVAAIADTLVAGPATVTTLLTASENVALSVAIVGSLAQFAPVARDVIEKARKLLGV
jgi:hypothetical protein